MYEGYCYAGPKDGEYIKSPHDCWIMLKPLGIIPITEQDTPLTVYRRVYGRYRWNYDRWIWEGWDDDVPKQRKSA